MLLIRRQVGGSFHIGLSTDPRPQHFDSIYPQEWFPFVNSVHPQSYWYTFRRTPEETLQSVYETWGSYGRPIIPALQGDAPVIDQNAAHSIATGRYGARGLSWWRYGVISQFNAVNLPVVLDPSEPVEPPGNFTDEEIVRPTDDGFRSGTYTGRKEFKQFMGTWGWEVFYKATEPAVSTVWAEWRTELNESGRYEIAAFIPQRHSSTERARYKIHGIRGTNTEVVIDINQAANRNRWVALGIFDLEKSQQNAGKVFLNDVTGEAGKEIAFDAIRFRRIVTVEEPEPVDPEPPSSGQDWIIDGVYIADGYDSPVGTATQRADDQLWPSGWRDATGFGSDTAPNYVANFGSYHTGVDLNVGRGGNDDIGVPVYAPASGIVTYQANLRPWGNVTVIKHDPLKGLSGLVTYSRYGHMQNVRVQVGQRVRRGEQIGEIGTGGGRYIAHLHYDISPTTVLEVQPGHWPGMNLSLLLKNYVDPLFFTRTNRPDDSRR
jgi:murein DD-endopeptidase MepM/ murein hydrolase activator NlpD